MKAMFYEEGFNLNIEVVINNLKVGKRFYAPYKYVGCYSTGGFYSESDFHPRKNITEEEAKIVINGLLKEYSDRCYVQ